LPGLLARSRAMKIKSHSESHVVELEDGSRWNVFPGDMDITLSWTPETDLTLIEVEYEIGSHVLDSEAGPVRVVRFGESWHDGDAKSFLQRG
jgi:hypothetical protein